MNQTRALALLKENVSQDRFLDHLLTKMHLRFIFQSQSWLVRDNIFK